MSIVAFVIGIAVPGVLGWLCVRLCEGSSPVLGKWERLFWSLSLGPTAMMLLVFTCHVTGLTKLNLVGFLLPTIIVIVVLGLLLWKVHGFRGSSDEPGFVTAGNVQGWKKYLVYALLVWTAVKLLAGAYDLFSVPTYWDDSFNNWNMRAKIFFVQEELVLEIPTGNDTVQTAQGVSSYPPTLSMVKTWVSVLRGGWSEPLVNGIHMIWVVGLLGSLYFALRREGGKLLGAIGLYALVSLPLLLIHSANPYAEIFVASHLFLAVYSLYRFALVQEGEASTWIRLFGLALGLLLFTKNEALLLYEPILGILFLWILWRKKRGGADPRALVRSIVPAIVLSIVLVLPWMIFKWMNGLTFGNAKAVSDTILSFNFLVVRSIWFNLTREPNFLLLPLVLPLALLAAGRRAFSGSVGILTWFVLLAAFLQFSIFTLVAALNTEAIMQTGLTRGLTHIAPLAVMVVLLIFSRFLRASSVSSTSSGSA